jgi:hypothetical protein
MTEKCVKNRPTFQVHPYNVMKVAFRARMQLTTLYTARGTRDGLQPDGSTTACTDVLLTVARPVNLPVIQSKSVSFMQSSS